MSWKTAVYDYVHAKNRAETEGNIEPLRAALADPIFLSEMSRILSAAKRKAEERGVRPIEQQTRLRILASRVLPSGAAADLELRRMFSYELKGQRHTEERVERERVTVKPRGDGRWSVTQVERLQAPDSYDRPIPGAMHHYARPELAGYGASVPYLNSSILNPNESSPRRVIYNRAAAVQYAETWWNGANPQYIQFEVDCTSFVSQCLYAGGLPMDYTGKRESGWWYRGRVHGQELWSYSWAVANSLMRYLLNSGRARQVRSPWELQLGDVICYDWDGDGTYQHNTIVTGMDITGAPLVNAHTYNARSRNWAYYDSPAWSERTTYVFLRIADQI
ncbi:hypothetical protein SD70_18595 [Gordoniibacillus kamchatkensis]|uniref:Putative amidase domain-containing protein n=1 Tax=Gordoniibacillus kamchatkensis TaxID=1590651 RepID=A0ABR5AF41_9BACL|nr:amidase domain-containing protein [Paenibacillus sp. VKM B-2647]KIL39654.1 hypothetical protein SD70_18595 [Paenibacillus sp. VKM B-2647]